MHPAFNANTPPVLKECNRDVVGHEIVAWAKTMAVDAVTEVEFEAVVFVLQTSHLFVVEGANELVEVSVCEP